MIPFASQRANGRDLATHLMNAQDNERVAVLGLRGAIADDLHGAFAEWEAQAAILTKCKKYLYSLSINPDQSQGDLTPEQYEDYIARVEDKLGLSDQPRAIVVHEKYGREHYHVVWSRIDAEHEKAIQLSFDKDKLMQVTRDFAREHHLELPDGYHKDTNDKDKETGKAGQESLYERHQQRMTGLTKEQRIEEVTTAWRSSDNANAFVHALTEKGYLLATGKRPYVLVDLYGEMNALPKLIADKNVRTKDIHALLETDFPPEKLPSVEEAKKLAAQHRRALEDKANDDKQSQKDTALEALRRNQTERRNALEAQQTALKQKQHKERQTLAKAQRTARDALITEYRQTMQNIHLERDKNRPTGLAEFLGRISGVNALRKQLHKWQDRKTLTAFKAMMQSLKTVQKDEQTALLHKQAMQKKDLARKVRALTSIEKREQRAVENALIAESRIAARGRDNTIPAIPLDAESSDSKTKALSQTDKEKLEAKLETEFTQAASGKTKQKKLDLEADFNAVAQPEEDEKEKSSGEGKKPKKENIIRRYGRKKDRDKDQDRGR